MSEEPRMVGMDGSPAGIRTFGMNEHRRHAGVHAEKRNREFYEAVCEHPGPWRWGPGIPSQPNSESPLVIVEPRR